ncbi:hypothetical protein PR202_ga11652 [Eleusine coracana subsp. coracana]|uniref:CRAL-TRIO domain-containing protein n=1 Tax=Eleusine coracana subsp. coracana TaxID=191504 RepID=A0AAV5C9K8_ELECO|nr:hypothetical protein PR202_ga11652 [Eleusine coracana subsp. coracana]
MPSFVSDTTIRRFLKARNWSTAQAGRCLKEAAKWRRQYQPEKIRWEDIVNSENEAKRAYIPDYQDKLGRTVFVTLPAEKIIKHFLEPKMKEKVKFVYKNNSDSQKVLAEMFDLDKLESKFGGRNTTEFDIVKYAERMKTLDQITGSRQHDSATTSSAIN